INVQGRCEYINLPGTSSSALRMLALSDSVMYSVLLSAPPNATLVVAIPAHDFTRYTGSPCASNIHTLPRPTCAIAKRPCSSNARPSGPPPPDIWMNNPTFTTSPLRVKGNRQIQLPRVTATYSMVSSRFITKPLGLG